MLEEAMNLPTRPKRSWLGLDSERNSTIEHTSQQAHDKLIESSDGVHTLLAAAAADVAHMDPSRPSDLSDTKAQERARAVKFIVCDSSQFRQLQAQIRSSGASTGVATQAVVNSLVDERMEIMRRIQECRMRELEEEREAIRALMEAQGTVSGSSKDDEGSKVGPGIKKDLWSAIKNAHTFISHARMAAEESNAAAAKHESFSSYGSSSLEGSSSSCCCLKDDDCTHFDATGWERPREMCEIKRSHSSPSPSSRMQPRRVVRVARGA